MYPTNLNFEIKPFSPNSERLDLLVDKINRNIQPLKAVTKETVNIRVMYIVSDAINSYGGCFPKKSLETIKDQIVDSPVLVGHRKDKLPLARNFHAELEIKDERLWVKTYFYWLKDVDKADDLLKQIDGGIYKECSIGFTFLLAECSICKKDIRTCQHNPLEEYRIGSGTQQCHFYYQEIDKVLETSLVYRGANPATSISDHLAVSVTESEPKLVRSLDELDRVYHYLVLPKYDGLFVELNRQSNLNGVEVDTAILKERLGYDSSRPLSGMLVGYRGKERCSKKQLLKYLNQNRGSVKRVEFKYFPLQNNIIKNSLANEQLKPIRYQLVAHHQLPTAIDRVKTKDGVLIFRAYPGREQREIYLYQPEKKKNNDIMLAYLDEVGACLLKIYSENSEKRLIISDFNLNKFLKGNRLLAQSTITEVEAETNTKLKCDILSAEKTEVNNSFIIAGDISGKLNLKKIKYKNRSGLFFVWLNGNKSETSKRGELVTGKQ